MLDKIKSIGENSLNSVSENINKGIDKGIEIKGNITESSLQIYDDISSLPLEKKEEILLFIENNKNVIINNLLEQTNKTEVDEMALTIIHGMLPFPFNLIIKEEAFINFGKKNLDEISKTINCINETLKESQPPEKE